MEYNFSVTTKDIVFSVYFVPTNETQREIVIDPTVYYSHLGSIEG